MDSISFGEPNLTWSCYGLSENPVFVNFKLSNYKAIMRQGELVAILSKWYELLPNEKALEIANEAAELANLKPFSFPVRHGWTPKEHVFYNNRKTRMHAWFAPHMKGEGGQVWSHGKDGDRIHIGVDVRNSIDGTSSFSCSLFTYRELCSNGVILGKQELASITKIHTKGLQSVISDLKNKMLLVMEQATYIMDRYRQMAEQELTNELIEKIRLSAIPKKVLPEYAKVKEEQKQLTNLSELTQWELYNDITELIWHNDEADITTKESQFRELHNVIPLRV